MQERELTTDQFIEEFVPRPGYILVVKDRGSAKRGSLITPQSIQDREHQYAGSGIIAKKSPFPPEDAEDVEFFHNLRVGDHVGFSSSVPVLAPLPPYCRLKNEDGSMDGTVILHCHDVKCWYLDSPERKEEFQGRLKNDR